MGVQTVVPSLYPIEISGWNVEGEFFVEKADLRWNDMGEKRVSLRESVRDGAVVFVRLMIRKSDNATFPIAYQAELITDQRSRGTIEMKLIPCQPRASEPKHDSTPDAHLQEVALHEKRA
ncbi:MAG: hypothetical protein ACLP1Y_12585 [Candidatus Acidiferrales bacterium]